MNLKTKPCKRCGGEGWLTWTRVMGGRCFTCGGRGFVYVDKFTAAMGGNATKFYGVSWEQRRGDDRITVKQIHSNLTCSPDNILSGCTLTEITEAQAAKFFARYGERVELQHA